MDEAVNYQRYLHRLVRRLAKPGQTIVDFGAGRGGFAHELSALGFTVQCIEADEEYRQILSAGGLTCHRSLDDIPDATVDYLYRLNVLEHIEDDLAVLRLWHRKLRPGAQLLLYVPAFMLLYTSNDRVVGHVRRYRRNALCSLVRTAGFEISGARYVDALGFLGLLAARLLDSGTGKINRRALIIFDRVIFPVSRVLDKLTLGLFGKNWVVHAVRP